MAIKVNFSERQRQEAAYDLLKAAGKKVKPNFSDYVTGRGRNRSLINRAEKLGLLSDFKSFTTANGDKTTFYATYDTEVPNLGPEDALIVADGMIKLYGRLFNRAQISMYGYAPGQSGRRGGPSEWRWVYGRMANINDAVASFADLASTIEVVTIVRVYLAKNR